MSPPPFIRMLCVDLLIIRAHVSSKTAMNPLSQKVPIKNSALFVRPGKTCASLASIGRFLCGINAVCMEWIISPLGILMGSGTLTIWFCLQGNVAVK